MKNNRTSVVYPVSLGISLMGVSILIVSAFFPLGVAAAGEEITIEGVLHVKNSATPGKGTETVELEELWRAGGDDEEVLFGLITQVISDDDGNVYLLDTQLSEVQVFTAEGEQLETLSRQGEGPGETNSPVDMLFMPDGSIGLVQSFPGKIVKVALNGDPAGSFTTGGGDPAEGGFVALIDVKQAAGNLVLGGIRITMDQAAGIQTRTNFLASFEKDGQQKVSYLEKATQWDFSNLKIKETDQYFVHFRHWALGPDGRVYAAAHRNEYAISVYNPDGTLDRVIERDFESRNRDEAEMARVNSVADAQRRQFPMEVDFELCDTEPDITTLRIAPDGTLWVLNSQSTREQPEGIMATYDVFDQSGHFVKMVAIACDGDGEKDGLIFAGSDRIILVTGFVDAAISLQGGASAETEDGEEPEPMEVICYEIKG